MFDVRDLKTDSIPNELTDTRCTTRVIHMVNRGVCVKGTNVWHVKGKVAYIEESHPTVPRTLFFSRAGIFSHHPTTCTKTDKKKVSDHE